MTLDLLILVVLCAGSFVGGYVLKGHMHAIADAAVAKVKDAADKVS